MEQYDEVNDVQEETPINRGDAVEPDTEEVSNQTASEEDAGGVAEQVDQDKEVPSDLVSKRHASNHVVMGWLMDVVNSHPEAEAVRAAILAAVAKSRDHGLLEVLDNVKAYIASHDRISGV